MIAILPLVLTVLFWTIPFFFPIAYSIHWFGVQYLSRLVPGNGIAGLFRRAIIVVMAFAPVVALLALSAAGYPTSSRWWYVFPVAGILSLAPVVLMVAVLFLAALSVQRK